MDFFLVVQLCAILLTSSVATDAHFPSDPRRNGSDYRLRYRQPSGCDPDTCDYFVGIDTNAENESFLDFYLVGQAKGWVAVGFSETANMFKSDVVGCSIDATTEGLVLVVDTFNPDSDRTNVLDDSEQSTQGHPSDVVTYSKQYVDGRIKCVFSRLIEGSDPCPQDMLLNKNYYLQFGISNRGRESANITVLYYHDGTTPTLSNEKYNPAKDSGEIGVSTLNEKLIAAHGALMLIAWPLLSFTAIFFAAWMKPALPNGEWFQVHRAFNLSSLAVAVVGFILVFIAHKDQSPPGLIPLGSDNKIGTAHFALGILIMALHLINPIISFCRCKPDDKHRWVFYVLHGLIVGYGVEALAYANVGLGISMYSSGWTVYRDQTLLWIYLAAAVFSIVLGCLLFAVFCGEAVIFKRNARTIAPSVVKMLWQCCNRYTELRSPRHDGPSITSPVSTNADLRNPFSAAKPRLPASRDAPLRWIALMGLLLVMIPVVIALITLMVVKNNTF